MQEKNANIDDVYKYMKKECVGCENAVTSWEIANKFGIEKRSVRLIMKDLLRKRGLPVISFQGAETGGKYKGWFVTSNRWELEKFIETLQRKVAPLLDRIKEVEKVYKDYSPNKQEVVNV